MSSSKQAATKREYYIDWQEYFMATAFLAAKRSKDPHFIVGACIVNENNRIVGTGYNGFPDGCSDEKLPWAKGNSDKKENKDLYVCHAELNAILNKCSTDLRGCVMYVGLFPCNTCAQMIIQSGIKKVYYVSDEKGKKPEFESSKIMFKEAGVEYEQYIPKQDTLVIDFYPNGKPVAGSSN